MPGRFDDDDTAIFCLLTRHRTLLRMFVADWAVMSGHNNFVCLTCPTGKFWPCRNQWQTSRSAPSEPASLDCDRGDLSRPLLRSSI